MYITTADGKLVNNVAIVQYSFIGETRSFELKTHGNSKGENGRGYTRTQPSTVKTLKDKCQGRRNGSRLISTDAKGSSS